MSNVETLANGLGDYVHAYEIWNEPDQPRAVYFKNGAVYDPALEAGQYADLLANSYDIIHNQQREKEPTVIVGGLDSGNTDYLGRVINNGGLFNAIAIHPYGKEDPVP